MEYVRHGTVSLLAALEVGSGRVEGRCVQRHTGEEFVRFLAQTVVGRPRKKVHVVLDNLPAHKTAAVKAWVTEHPSVQLHFTPTYSSWLNQVEIWLGLITRDCIRRGVFKSVPDLTKKIMSYIRLYNRSVRPFCWMCRNPRHRIRVSPISVTRHLVPIQEFGFPQSGLRGMPVFAGAPPSGGWDREAVALASNKRLTAPPFGRGTGPFFEAGTLPGM